MKRITLFAALLISSALSLPAQDIVVAERIFDYVISDTPSTIANMEALIGSLWGYGETFKLTEFTDADSMKAYVGNNLRNNQYFNYEKYGEKYPLEYWDVNEEGKLCLYHYFNYET